MSRTSSALVRLLGPASAAAALVIGSMPAFAQTAPTTTTSTTTTTTSTETMGCNGVHFELANPSAGAFLEPGGLVIEGIALDSPPRPAPASIASTSSSATATKVE